MNSINILQGTTLSLPTIYSHHENVVRLSLSLSIGIFLLLGDKQVLIRWPSTDQEQMNQNLTRLPEIKKGRLADVTHLYVGWLLFHHKHDSCILT